MPLDLDDIVAAVAREPARDHLAAPGAGRAVDAIEIVGGGIVLAGRRFRADGTPTTGMRRRGPSSQISECT